MNELTISSTSIKGQTHAAIYTKEANGRDPEVTYTVGFVGGGLEVLVWVGNEVVRMQGVSWD